MKTQPSWGGVFLFSKKSYAGGGDQKQENNIGKNHKHSRHRMTRVDNEKGYENG
jgi:hypothetical protein